MHLHDYLSWRAYTSLKMIPLSSLEVPEFKRPLSSRYSSLLNVYSGASTIAKRFKNLIQAPTRQLGQGVITDSQY